MGRWGEGNELEGYVYKCWGLLMVSRRTYMYRILYKLLQLTANSLIFRIQFLYSSQCSPLDLTLPHLALVCACRGVAILYKDL